MGDAHTRGEHLDATHVPDECPVSQLPRRTSGITSSGPLLSNPEVLGSIPNGGTAFFLFVEKVFRSKDFTHLCEMSHKIDRDFTPWPSVIIRPAEVVHFSSSSRLCISEGRRALRASRSFGSDGGFRRAFGRPRRVRRGRGPRGVRRRAHGGACARDVTPVVVSSSFESPQVPPFGSPRVDR